MLKKYFVLRCNLNTFKRQLVDKKIELSNIEISGKDHSYTSLWDEIKQLEYEVELSESKLTGFVELHEKIIIKVTKSMGFKKFDLSEEIAICEKIQMQIAIALVNLKKNIDYTYNQLKRTGSEKTYGNRCHYGKDIKKKLKQKDGLIKTFNEQCFNMEILLNELNG